MAIKLTTANDGSIEVWLIQGPSHSKTAARIGRAKTADVALSEAMTTLSGEVLLLADRQRLSAVEDYKRREPV